MSINVLLIVLVSALCPFVIYLDKLFLIKLFSLTYD